jgi:hypothetical protein
VTKASRTRVLVAYRGIPLFGFDAPVEAIGIALELLDFTGVDVVNSLPGPQLVTVESADELDDLLVERVPGYGLAASTKGACTQMLDAQLACMKLAALVPAGMVGRA